MKPDLKIKIGIISISIISLIVAFIFVSKNNNTNNELVVKYKNSDRIELLRFDNKKSLKITKNNLENDEGVKYVSNNNKYKIAYLPNDPDLPSQDYLKQIRADLAWTFSRNSKDVVVAVIDTGIDTNHPDLKDNIWWNKNEIDADNIDNDNNGYIDDIYGWDFVNNSADSGIKISRGFKKYAVNHGTVVAGIIGAVGNNNEGISGVTWNVQIMSLRAIDSQGEGNTYNIARAIDYAIKNNVDVINLSFVGNENDPILADAIRRASEAQIAIVAAAGNEINPGMDLNVYPKYPVCYDFNENTVFGVGSVNKNNLLSTFSNYGSNCIDILAPGENLKSTTVFYPDLFDFKEKYGSEYSGTSLSAPLVSGTIALIKSINPSLTVQEIYKIIKDSAKNIAFENFDKRKQIGAGLLDVNNALIMTRSISLNRQVSIITLPKTSYNYSLKIFHQENEDIEQKILKEKNVNGFKNTYNIKTGDLNGDKKQEIVIASTNNIGTQINIYDENFKNIGSFKLQYKNPIGLEIADLYKTGREKIIVSSPVGYEPKISIYDIDGTLLKSFPIYTKGLKTGISIAVCDIDNDFQKEIITAPKKGAAPHVLFYSKEGVLKGQFFAGNKQFKGGLNIACGDLNNDKKNELVITTESLNFPYVLVYNKNGELLSSFLAYEENFRNELVASIADIDFDYQNEIILNTTSGNASQIKIFDIYGDLKKEFFAYDSKDKSGVALTVFKKNATNN